MTTTSTTTSVSGSSILSSLGAGSGVDTAALVKQLVEAQFSAKNASLSAQDTALNAQISSVAKVQSAITSFSSALSSLVTGGSLATQPTSSDSGVLTATALPGAKLSGLSTQVTVNKLATAQTATASFPSGAPTFDTGTLTLTFGTASDDTVASLTNPTDPISISIAQGASLADVAKSINASGKGLTATVVSDVDGATYLALKGPTGKAQAFTLSGTGTLAQLNVGGASNAAKINTAAGNANLTVDGVTVDRASNTISDLVPGVKLTLTGVSPGAGSGSAVKPVTLGSTTPTDGIGQAVSNFVTTYNEVLAELKTETDATNGPLRNDYNATNLMRSLRGLTLTTLSSDAAPGDPVNLASIGVSTNKDGTLSVDSAKLNTALLQTPAAVEALFANGTGASGGGLAAALSAITTAATNNKVVINGQTESTGLVGSTALYTAKLAKVTDAEAKVATDTAAYQERLTKQYAASDAIVAAYKASASSLQSQIDQWNKSS
ncbi:flagellar filament capping protein FliD [Sphingomonas glacialis]|uniref:Flagellar hook-associated protein 2 n=1 Tax=Sphingomonas glacialis TaxID=658225 RepID=A0A502FQH2_9SPHN|nr:flagellar filament capping protein FliD [Sphingomonas glacialis]TPG51661.1 flagellar hook protein [Sphingomonas glacialis]